jgi:hypothetical protein
MSGRSALQEYEARPSGRRRPVHTPRLTASCACISCVRRRWWTPERRAARGEQIRAAYAAGTRRVGRDGNRKKVTFWQPQQDAALRELAGRYDSLTIAQILSERFGQPRTATAVTHRCKTLGISRMDIRPLTSSEVGRIFGGISRETVRVRFVKSGLLVGTLRRGGPHGMRMFTRADLERLIREHPEAYDAATIRDPALRALAGATRRGRRLLPTSEVTRLTGIDNRTLAGWYAAGRVPTARKVHGVLPGATGAWLIEAGDLATVRAIRDGYAAGARARAAARRDPLTGTFLGAGETPAPTLRCGIRIVDREAAIGRLIHSGGGAAGSA